MTIPTRALSAPTRARLLRHGACVAVFALLALALGAAPAGAAHPGGSSSAARPAAAGRAAGAV